MHPSALFLIVVAYGAAMVHGHSAANTPAAQFWEQALPGSPMPDAIADLFRKAPHCRIAQKQSQCVRALRLYMQLADGGRDRHLLQHGTAPSGQHHDALLPAEAEPAAILPHDVALNVPFSNLDDVLSTFSIPSASDDAARFRDTLTRCQAPPLAGVVKSCSTSLEATVQAAMRILGTDHDGVTMAAATLEIPRSGLPRQPYVVQAVTQLASDSDHWICLMIFLKGGYLLSLDSLDYDKNLYDDILEVIDRAYEKYIIAGGVYQPIRKKKIYFRHKFWHTRPGGSPVCHFTTYGSLAVVRKASTRG
ncbi:hypothetical protein QOZ80_5AG0397020 [Eleusine coracana subsp. coracana]|nr:hypothetical protein QOZ80_5AG0397020 [Eleusine coracana subsp. coracana]